MMSSSCCNSPVLVRYSEELQEDVLICSECMFQCKEGDTQCLKDVGDVKNHSGNMSTE